MEENTEVSVVSDSSRPWKPWGIILTTIFAVLALVLGILAFMGVVVAFLAPHFDALARMVKLHEPSQADILAYLFRVMNWDVMIFASWFAYGLTIILAVALFVRLRKGSSLREYLCLNHVGKRAFGFWICTAVVFVAITEIVNHALKIETSDTSWITKSFSGIIPGFEYVPALWVFFAVFILIAPICEEILFRGFLMRGFLGFRPSDIRTWFVILVTSSIFAILHSQYTPIVMAEVGVIGVLMGLARVKTNSLFTPFMMHVAVNSIAFIGVVFSRL